MINDDTRGLAEFCRRDVFGTRIAALFTAYGSGFRDMSFRVQRSVGEIVAAVSVCEGAAVVCASEKADFDELAAYLRFSGFSSLMCEKSVREKLRITSVKSGFVVRTDGRECESLSDVVSDIHCDFSYRAVYDILKKCEFDIGGYPSWLADISLRCRRGTAKIIAVRDNGSFVSTASALYITDSAVLLGAVGTLPQTRGKGFAGKTVNSLAREAIAKGKRVELLCEEKRLSFYKQNGFYTVGEWTQ